jgi:hypothetical protein
MMMIILQSLSQAEARVKKSLPITPKFKSASATTDSAKNRQSYLKSCYSIFKFASPHPKVISDFLYEEELLNLRIQAPVCSAAGGNDFLTPASGVYGSRQAHLKGFQMRCASVVVQHEEGRRCETLCLVMKSL